MNVNMIYPSKYVSSADLQGQRITVTVQSLSMEAVGDDKEQKPVMRFVGKEKSFVVNKTNLMLMSSVWGDETLAWSGKTMDLFAQPVSYQGKLVQGLTVMPHIAAGSTQMHATPAAAPVQDFDRSARGDAPSGPHDFVPEAEAELQDQNAGNDFDDIPF